MNPSEVVEMVERWRQHWAPVKEMMCLLPVYLLAQSHKYAHSVLPNMV